MTTVVDTATTMRMIIDVHMSSIFVLHSICNLMIPDEVKLGRHEHTPTGCKGGANSGCEKLSGASAAEPLCTLQALPESLGHALLGSRRKLLWPQALPRPTCTHTQTIDMGNTQEQCLTC